MERRPEYPPSQTDRRRPTQPPAPPRNQLQNWVLVAPKEPRGWTKSDIVARAAGDDGLRKMAANLVDPAELDLAAATVLTDEFSPVEYLAAQQLRQ